MVSFCWYGPNISLLNFPILTLIDCRISIHGKNKIMHTKLIKINTLDYWIWILYRNQWSLPILWQHLQFPCKTEHLWRNYLIADQVGELKNLQSSFKKQFEVRNTSLLTTCTNALITTSIPEKCYCWSEREIHESQMIFRNINEKIVHVYDKRVKRLNIFINQQTFFVRKNF